LLPLDQRASASAEPAYLAGLLEISVDIELLKNELVFLGASLQQKSASQLSRMERSILSSRVLAFSKDTTQPIASFIEESVTLLSEWIDNSAMNRSKMEVSVFKRSLCILC
jgi:hypothetical protein